MPYTRVIIVGGGFGGLNAAKSLAKANVDVLLFDKTNHHVFQPLLYQVATAALSPGNIAVPIREVVRFQENTSVVMANALTVDKDQQQVLLSDGEVFNYDYLILAPGGSHSYFGHDDWEGNAPGLKTVKDALRIREKILLAFELAERCDSISESAKYLRFVIIGGGPTGVEMSGAIAEICRKTMFKNFRKIKPEQSQIYLIEGMSQILPSYPPHLANIARRDLEKLGVKVFTGSIVTSVTAQGVYIGNKLIESNTVIWAAGNQASPLLKTLDAPLDRQGRVIVEKDLSLAGYPDLFVIGDAALVVDDKGAILPGIAPVAIQQARYVAQIIKKGIPKEKRQAFRYFDKGTMATIGKAKAVAVVGKLQFSGFLAWLAWGLIHILYLISFSNRLLVITQWFFWYLTGKRNVRVISNPINEVKKEQPSPKKKETEKTEAEVKV